MSPQPLPEPPADYALLVDFPVRPKGQVPHYVYRVHRVVNEPEYFSSSSTWRWDPPPAATPLFGTCYAADRPATALIEALGELRSVTEEMIDARAVAVIEVPEETRFADMTNGRIVGDWGLDERISVGDNYDICQRWASALQAAGFAGVYYNPRHDPTGLGFSIAFFADPGVQAAAITVVSDGPITEAHIQEAYDTFHLRIVPAAPLLPPPLP